jgi:hypothetical protein
MTGKSGESPRPQKGRGERVSEGFIHDLICDRY